MGTLNEDLDSRQKLSEMIEKEAESLIKTCPSLIKKKNLDKDVEPDRRHNSSLIYLA